MSLHNGSLPQGKRFSILHETIATLRAAGIRPEVRSGRGSHFKLVWHDRLGAQRTFSVPRNSGEWHQSRVYAGKLRRILEARPL
jgi:hypothetical protein